MENWRTALTIIVVIALLLTAPAGGFDQDRPSGQPNEKSETRLSDAGHQN